MTFILLCATALMYRVGRCGEVDRFVPSEPSAGQSFNLPKGPDRLPAYLELDHVFQSGKLCGPNGLYLILRVAGKQVTYQQVLERFTVGPSGVSLADIQRVAEEFGLHGELRKNLSPSELLRTPMPAIVHLATSSPDSSSAAKDHFLVLTRVKPRFTHSSEIEANGFDTTNLLRVVFTGASLSRSMSGYALLFDLGYSPHSSGNIVISGLCWILCFALSAFVLILAIRIVQRLIR
jgi:ABC-type bacteriocin/lantibiotic exporter with double-glycine peptidase domain